MFLIKKWRSIEIPSRFRGVRSYLAMGSQQMTCVKNSFLNRGRCSASLSGCFEIGSSGILTWYIIALRDLPQEFLHLSSLDLTFVLCKFMLTCLSAIS